MPAEYATLDLRRPTAGLIDLCASGFALKIRYDPGQQQTENRETQHSALDRSVAHCAPHAFSTLFSKEPP